jgi:RNA polymerase sigma factor (sigma-70 family)
MRAYPCPVSNPSRPTRRSTPVWSVSDDALLAGLATGDHDSASAFVERFQRRVYGLAVTIVGDARAAEDVAQEAFLRAWRHAGAYDARRGSVVTWLLTITRNAAIDTLRVRRPVFVDPEVLTELVAAERGPEAHAIAATEGARLREAMRKLPDEQQRALLLAAFSGHTAREIAAIEAIPLGTAKTRIRTAMIRLREALVERGVAE